MLRVTGKIVDLQAVLRVGLQRFDPVAPSVQPVSPAPALDIGEYRALIDTGAQLTCITRRAVRECGLLSFGKRQISGVGGLNAHRVYLFRIGLWCEASARGTPLDAGSGLSYYGIPEVQSAVEIPDNSEFDVIIGMNILGKFDLTLSRTGEFTLSIE